MFIYKGVKYACDHTINARSKSVLWRVPPAKVCGSVGGIMVRS